MTILLNGKEVSPLATILHRSKAHIHGRELALKLKDVIPRQMYALAIQAVIEGKVIARET
jgi:GTP-binding protein LepA